ncbi:MAG: hypothetical protein KAS04_05030 [Candidatus Aenigmarchaeota archaeon]|nr:hypothetical protein [Candidatus Aenigmarchaeota archaeon]
MKVSKLLGAVLFLLALNCFFSSVSAQNFDYYGIESTIHGDMNVNNVIKINIDESVPFFEYKVKYRILNVKVESEYADVSCETKVKDTSTISCSFTDFENYDMTKLVIEFDSRDMVEQVDDNFEFNHFVSIDESVTRLFHVVYLPETASLVGDSSFSPKYGNILSDGKHIMISWDKGDMVNGDDVYFTASYILPEGNAMDIWIMVIIALIIITSLGVFYMKTTRRHSSIKVIMPLLKGDEKIVVDIISNNDGEVNQRVIVKESDFSKAKVSRIIADMKERGIVDVEVLGRSNKITLKVKK